VLQARCAEQLELCAQGGESRRGGTAPRSRPSRNCQPDADPQPKAQITTVENLPTTSLESALPPTAAATTLLAPEEMFAPPTSRDLVARSEQTPEEAHAARAKRRREKKAERTKLGEMAELYGKKRPQGGVKGEKERALAGLVKTGKGVTVLGKGEKERGKAAKRAAGAAGTEDREGGKRLKL